MSTKTQPGTLKAAIVEIERLRTLVEASKLINSSIESDRLFDSILEVARHGLEGFHHHAHEKRHCGDLGRGCQERRHRFVGREW